MLEAETIVDGVRVVPVRSPTLPPATHTNVWLLGDHHIIVVDPASPYPDEQERLDNILENYMVELIFLTHHHVDHISGAEDVRKRCGARIAAHPLTAERVGFTVDELVNDGDILGTDAGAWRAIHTPGHAVGHLCLYNPGMGLVAGDMVAGLGTILLDPPEGNLGGVSCKCAQTQLPLIPNRIPWGTPADTPRGAQGVPQGPKGYTKGSAGTRGDPGG